MDANAPTSMVVNILAKKEGDIWVGHCLELDIVATAESIDRLRRDMADLIIAQIDYAFRHNNLDHLFRPAPAEVWAEFYRCRRQEEERITVESDSDAEAFVPPWIIAKTCFQENPSLV